MPDTDAAPTARDYARQRALQRAPGGVPGTVAASIADAASDAWEPSVRAAYHLLRDEFGIDGELDPDTPSTVAEAVLYLRNLLGEP